MVDSILQSFLDHQFIKTDDLKHIENLQKTSNAIQRLLKQQKNKPKVINYTLVALDSTISADDPVIVEVEKLIIKNWPAFRNSVVKTKDRPIVYIQAVILEALNVLSKDEKYGAIIWHTGRNIVSHYKLAGQEELLTQLLLEIGIKIERIACSNWDLLEKTTIDTIDQIELSLPKIPLANVDEDEFKNQLLAAAVHKPWAAKAGGGENPHQAATQDWNWSKFFAERAAKGLSEVINDALSTQNNSMASVSKSIQEAISSFIVNLTPHLDQVSSAILQSSQSISKRSDLLWWKQALYSKSLDCSYRSLKPLTMTIAMAVDFAGIVTPIYPKSVDFLLEESLRDVLGDEAEKRMLLTEILELLEHFSEDEELLLDEIFNDNENRKPFGSCMANVLKEGMNKEYFFKHTGIEETAEISLKTLAVWLFHDLQANTLVKAR